MRVKGDNLGSKGGALGFELRVEGFKVKEDCLFGLLHLFCTLAGNGDENEMFLIHDYTRLNIKQLGCSSLCGTRFYNNAAKNFGAEGILRRSLDGLVFNMDIKKAEDIENQSLPL